MLKRARALLPAILLGGKPSVLAKLRQNGAATQQADDLDAALPWLVDPQTHEPLLRARPNALVAPSSRRSYPIVDGIPWLAAGHGVASDGNTARRTPEPKRPTNEVSVLDIGTKNGKGIHAFRNKHAQRFGFDNADWHIVGIDVSHRRLLQAKERGIVAIKGDGAKLPFRDESFDLTVVTELLEHVPRPLAVDVVREARRVTRGLIFIQHPDFTSEEYLRSRELKFSWMDWSVHPHHITIEGMRSLLTEAGIAKFKVQQLRPVHDSDHREILPLSAPHNTLFFDPALHQKPRVSFDQPVYEKMRVVLDLRARKKKKAGIGRPSFE